MSGNVLLIFSLLFALVIYNSYQAFITSVLSVKYAKIKSLGDLADSDFAFGYTLGGNDDFYLRVRPFKWRGNLKKNKKFLKKENLGTKE